MKSVNVVAFGTNAEQLVEADESSPHQHPQSTKRNQARFPVGFGNL